MEDYMDDRVLKIIYAAHQNKRFVMSGTLQDLCTQRKEMCCIICINDLDISAPQTSWH